MKLAGPDTTAIADLGRFQSLYPDWVIPKFMTELNPHDTSEAWDPAQPGWMKLAVTMHHVFTHERANNYVVWTSMSGFIDRFTGLPNHANYYALAHFSRFVNARNWRVAASSDDAGARRPFLTASPSPPAGATTSFRGLAPPPAYRIRIPRRFPKQRKPKPSESSPRQARPGALSDLR